MYVPGIKNQYSTVCPIKFFHFVKFYKKKPVCCIDMKQL